MEQRTDSSERDSRRVTAMSQLEIVMQVCGAEEERRREKDEHGARQAVREQKRDGRAVDEFLGERCDRVVAQSDPLAVRLRRGACNEHERVNR